MMYNTARIFQQQQQQQQQQQHPQQINKINNNEKQEINSSIVNNMSMVAQTKGLLNMPGQNNCFLNSAVQVLWHLDIFRRSFRELSGHACMGHDSCIFCALKELFMQFQYSQETALPPDSLRRALAETFSDQRRFQLGFMDDAAECFENMLLRLHYHLVQDESEDNCTAPHCISHQKFAMNLEERIICSTCGATSEPLPFTQLVHYVSTSALCHQSKKYTRSLINLSFGELLRSAGALGDFRDCPKSCGTRVQIKKTLFNTPDIVSIGLVWDSERPNINQISDVFKIIGTSLRLQDVFDQYNCPQGAMSNSNVQTCILQLVGLVTYYGKHYSTFFYHTKLAAWIYFDDATVREIGPHWQQVIEKCIRGHFQPLLLLYANPNGSSVDTLNAPQVITAMTHGPSGKKMSQSQSYIVNNGIKRNALLASRQNNTILQNQSVIDTNYLNNYNQDLQHIVLNLNRYKRNRPGSVDDLLSNYASASEDVPDSPLTKSSTSSAYFSDIGEMESVNFNQRKIDSYVYQQKMQHKLQQKFQRSSSSSIDSFVEANARVMAKNYEESIPNKKICSLQRRDSGNSSNGSGSGDRNSSSSGSSVTSENPYFTIPTSLKHHLPPNCLMQPLSPNKDRNGHCDYGYDSYSLSSSDSYPVNGIPISPSKTQQQLQQRKLSQIPEDVQYLGLINQSNLLDCDKLCSEADVLLLKSHEKEREGEIKEAALLSDTAAQKARSAMEAPYSNPQALITAKMKHSMCVMRSASLHRRVRENEAEEKRRLKAESLQISHSRQGSRDSLHGKHSRQNSKDNLININNKKENDNDNNNNNNNISNNTQYQQRMKTMELYGTLPKKSTKKKLNQTNLLGSSASLRLKEDNKHTLIETIKSSLSLTNQSTSGLSSTNNTQQQQQHCTLRKQEKINCKENKKDLENIFKYNTSSSIRKVKVNNNKNCYNKESDFSDYYSEFEVRSASKIPVQKSLSGSISCRETESEYYAEVGEIQIKKQNRVRRKLLMGGFMKRKNRSLPDLRDGNDTVDTGTLPKISDDTVTCRSIAQVNKKGFHALNGISDKGIYQKAFLLKVNPPLVEKTSLQNKTTNLTSPVKSNTLTTNVTSATLTVKQLLKTQNENLNCTSSPARTPSPPPPLPPHPLHDQFNYTNVTTKIISSTLEIEPCDELPPPPEDFLQDLREKRMEEMPKEIEKEQTNNRLSLNIKKINQRINSLTNVFTPSASTLNQTVSTSSLSPPSNDSKQITPKTNIETKMTTEKSLISVKSLASKFEMLAVNPVNEENTNERIAQTTQNTSLKSTINNITLKTESINKDDVKASTLSITSSALNVNRNTTKVTSPLISNSLTTTTTTCNSMIKPINQQTNNSLINDVHKNSSSRPASIYGTIKSLDQNTSHLNLNPSFIPPPSPSLSISSTSTYGCSRPVRPPDYQTAMKRLGLMKAEMSSLMQQHFVSTSNSSSVLNVNMNTNYRTSNEDLINTSNNRNKQRSGPKKSVSFSDQVVLVAPAEAEEEEHFPNPLLDRVLANSNILSMK